MATDIFVDEDYDLFFAGGDFLIGLSDQQHVAILAEVFPAEFKRYPTAGMGLNRRLLSTERNNSAAVRHIIDRQLKADGVLFKKVMYRNGTIEIDAKY